MSLIYPEKNTDMPHITDQYTQRKTPTCLVSLIYPEKNTDMPRVTDKFDNIVVLEKNTGMVFLSCHINLVTVFDY